MIKNLVFDLGNVLVRYEPVEFLINYCGSEEEARLLANMLFAGPAWKDGDLGKKTREEIISALCTEYPDKAIQINRIMSNCNSMLTANEDTLPLLCELKNAGYSLYYLTNTSPEAFTYIDNTYGYFKYFSGGVRSYECGLLKPQREIYELLLKKYGLNAEECLFIDDMPVNTAAAEKLGFSVLNLGSPDNLCAPLMRILEKNGIPPVTK